MKYIEWDKLYKNYRYYLDVVGGFLFLFFFLFLAVLKVGLDYWWCFTVQLLDALSVTEPFCFVLCEFDVFYKVC